MLPLTPSFCRQCGIELSDEAIRAQIDLCPDCGGEVESEEERSGEEE